MHIVSHKHTILGVHDIDNKVNKYLLSGHVWLPDVKTSFHHGNSWPPYQPAGNPEIILEKLPIHTLFISVFDLVLSDNVWACFCLIIQWLKGLLRLQQFSLLWEDFYQKLSFNCTYCNGFYAIVTIHHQFILRKNFLKLFSARLNVSCTVWCDA